jgi:hypothetical protein
MASTLKPGRGPLDYGSRLWLKVLFATIFFLLYAPIITLIALTPAIDALRSELSSAPPSRR